MVTRRPLVASAGQSVELPSGDTLPASALGYTMGSNANGSWRKDPDGTIEQFGRVTLVNGAATITFPLPFPTVCLHLDPVPVINPGTGASVGAWLTAEPTKTGAIINGRTTATVLGLLTVGAGAFDVKWHAIGS